MQATIFSEKLANRKMEVYDNVESMIPNKDNPTPLVKVNGRINSLEHFNIYLKLESLNAFGSIKLQSNSFRSQVI